MCEICGREPCSKYCPNERVDTESDLYCDFCDGLIEFGDEYINAEQDRGEYIVCERCLKRIAKEGVWALLEFLGIDRKIHNEFD